MADVATLEAAIKRLKKTLSEKPKDSGAEGSPEMRTFRKQLKRLQRRRRVLLTWAQHGTKAKEQTAEKETKPSAPSVEKAVEPG